MILNRVDDFSHLLLTDVFTDAVIEKWGINDEFINQISARLGDMFTAKNKRDGDDEVRLEGDDYIWMAVQYLGQQGCPGARCAKNDEHDFSTIINEVRKLYKDV